MSPARLRLRSRDAGVRPTVDEVVEALVRARLRNNRNLVAAVCGETGSGKSYASLRLGELIDPEFSADDVVFSVAEFLDALEQKGAGEVIIFDEGQEWNARRAMSKKNVQMTEIMAMLRFTRVNIIFTAPAISMMDVSLRRLMHLYLFIEPVDRTRCPVWQRTKTKALLYGVQNPRLPGREQTAGGVRFVRPWVPIVRNGQRRTVRVSTLWLRAPDPGLVAAYEARKREIFQDRLGAARRNLPAPPPSRSEASTPPPAHAGGSNLTEIFGGT